MTTHVQCTILYAEVSFMTNVTIRMNEGLKKRSEALFEEMG